MDKIVYYLANAPSFIGPFFLLLGLLIFVHELGHFLVAKFFGVRVEVFSLGFGKKLLQKKIGDTTYCISLIPLGGYVKMYGDDPTMDVPADQRQFAFLHKPVWPRIAIVLAGPLMNLFFAMLLFGVIGFVGEELPAATVGDIRADSKAYSAGFRAGDKIVQINDQSIPSWIHAREVIESSGGKPLKVQVERKLGGQSSAAAFEVTPTFGDNENIFSTRNKVGQIDGLTVESRSTLIGISEPESAAAKSGLSTLDIVTAIDGQKVSTWREMNDLLAQKLNGKASTLKFSARHIEKAEKDTREVSLTVPKGWSANKDAMQFLGLESAELFIYKVKKGSPAEVAGLQEKDKLLSVNNQPIRSWGDVIELIKAFKPDGKPFEFTVSRDGNQKNFELRPEMTALMNTKGQEEQRFTVGIVSGFLQITPEAVFYKVRGPVAMVRYGMEQTVQWTGFVVMSLVRLVQGDVSAKNIGGVITIGRVASHSFSAGLSAFLKTMAIISINLFLLNLLPVPILDGGHLVFYTIEALRGAPLSMRKMEIAQQIGLMLLMFLMVFAFFNDISNLLSSQW